MTMKRVCLPLLAIVCLLLTGCAAQPAAEPAATETTLSEITEPSFVPTEPEATEPTAVQTTKRLTESDLADWRMEGKTEDFLYQTGTRYWCERLLRIISQTSQFKMLAKPYAIRAGS